MEIQYFSIKKGTCYSLPLKCQTKIAADDTLIFLLLSFEEHKA